MKTVINMAKPHTVAKQFRDLTKPNLVNFQDEWLSYDGAAYQPIENDSIAAEISEFLRESIVIRFDEVGGVVKKKPVAFAPKAKDINEVYTQLKHLCHRPANTMAPPSWLDGRTEPNPRHLIAFQNGLLDITTRKFHEPTPMFFTRTALPIEFSDLMPVAPTRWLQFINEVTADNGALANLIQEMFGYLISSDTSQQKVFFLFGKTRSGKGTILRIMTALVGPLNISNPPIESLAGEFGCQDLIGKSVAIVSDLACHDRKALAAAANRINAISGEDAIRANRKHKDFWNGTLGTRFVVASNSIPDFGEHSSALGSRLIGIPFDVSFYGREDFGLTRTLLTELPGILDWALEGLTRLRRRGRFEIPPESDAIKSRMLHLSNPVRGFVEEYIDTVADATALKSDVHEAYESYCTNVLKVKPLSLDAFAEQIYSVVQTAGASKQAPSAGRRPIFTGIRLKPEIMARMYVCEDGDGDLTGFTFKTDKHGNPVRRGDWDEPTLH